MDSFNKSEFDQIIEKIVNSPEVLTIKTTPEKLFILISWLQLALRHPHESISKQEVELLTYKLAEILTSVIPEAQSLLDLGWRSEYDITQSYFESEFDIE